MQKRHATTVLLTATLAVLLAAVPLRHLALTPAQAQQEGPSHQPGVPIFGEALPSENNLPTLELTGQQAKAAVLDGETFTAKAIELSPGVPIDLARYQMRLIQRKSSLKFTGIFERDGVSVLTPYSEAIDTNDPGITIDGDELKALITVTQAIRDPKQRLRYRFDYDITNYDVRIQRDTKVIHIYCDTSIFGVYWPKIANNSNNKSPELAFVGKDTSVSLRFDVSRESNRITKTSMMAD